VKQVIFHIDVNSAFLSWEAVYRLKEQNGTVDQIRKKFGSNAIMRASFLDNKREKK